MRTLSTALQLLVLRDAARGMAHLHAHAARHCNLRAANLLLFDPFVVKVALTLAFTLTLTLTLKPLGPIGRAWRPSNTVLSLTLTLALTLTLTPNLTLTLTQP